MIPIFQPNCRMWAITHKKNCACWKIEKERILSVPDHIPVDFPNSVNITTVFCGESVNIITNKRVNTVNITTQLLNEAHL